MRPPGRCDRAAATPLTVASKELACGLTAMAVGLAVCSPIPPSAATAAPARAATVAGRCAMRPVDVVLDRASFATVPGARRTEAQRALRRTFFTEFASTFRRMCMRGLISPRALRGVSRIRIVNAEGEADGLFGARLAGGTIAFDYFFATMRAPPRAAIEHGLRCLSRPTTSCSED